MVGLAGDYSHLIAPATTTGKNVMPRVAALLDVAQISDISAVVSADTFVRPIYAGNALATVQSKDKIKIITVRCTAFAPAAATGGNAPIETVEKAEAPGIIPPQREKMKTEMEALIYHFKIFTEGFSPQPGQAFVSVESPRGELGCFVASDGSPKPLRVHFRSPSFINLQALPKLIKGQLIADVVACIGTIDIVLGEVDR
jgi:hypothetical protein